jgi:hypothetical protein
MVTSRAPVVDHISCDQAMGAAAKGDRATARMITSRIEVPRFKARALAAIALEEPDADAALDGWMEAVIIARRAGRGEVERLFPSGRSILLKSGRDLDATALDTRVADTDAAWQLELFVEEYASLRASRPPGSQRTRVLDYLMLVPIQSGKARHWTREEVRLAWDRGEDGARLFALGLMNGDDKLVIADVLVQGIRASRSAFEQYYALLAARELDPKSEDSIKVRRAIQDELDGIPRPDGSPAMINAEPTLHNLALDVMRLTSKPA